MSAQTSMLHVRVDEQLKKNATEILANFGLSISDAVRILLTRIEKDGSLPVGLTADEKSYDAWFRRKVRESLEDDSPDEDHDTVMESIDQRLKK